MMPRKLLRGDTQFSYFPIALLLLTYFAVRSLYFDYVLIYDSRVYYESILYAQKRPFDLLNYSGGLVSTGGHNGQLWMLLAGLPNYLFPHSYYAYNIWIALLGTASVGAFYNIVTLLAAQYISTGERLLITALFAFHPSVFASQVHVTLDTGLLIFWLWFLLALLKEKTVIAAVIGCFLLFTKEPAMAHLPIVFIFCALRQPNELRLCWIKKHSAAVVAPFSLLVLFLLYKTEYRHQPLFYGGFLQHYNRLVPPGKKILASLDASFINFALMALVLNFNWVITCLGTFLTVRLYKMPNTDHWICYKRQALAFIWFFLATLCVVLAVRHWSNVRYLLPIFPVMILCFTYLLPLISNNNARFGFLVLLLAALCWQNFRSVDPVSNTVFCTSPFGQHRLLQIHTDDVCKLNHPDPRMARDQTAYNLEFIHIPLLINAIMKDVRPHNRTTFIVDQEFTYKVFGGLDKNYRLTYTNARIWPTVYALALKRLNPRFTKFLPDIFYYIEFPTESNSAYRGYFLARYCKVTEKIYDIDGYQLTVVKFQRKNAGKSCAPK